MRRLWGGVVAVALVLLVVRIGSRARVSGDERSSEPTRGVALLESARALAPSVEDGPPDREALPVSVPEARAGCLIRVLRDADGEPLPAAELLVQRREVARDGFAWRAAMACLADVESVLRSGLGESIELDEHGEALVPAPAQPLAFAAAFGNLRAEGILRPETRLAEFRLEPYTRVLCEVVDPGGATLVGALVTLFSGEFDPLDSAHSFVTDARGRVEILRLEEHLDTEASEFRVALGRGLRGEPEVHVVALDQVPDEPLRFVVREYGSVVVEWVDVRGDALSPGGWVELEVQPESGLPLGSQRLGQSFERRPFEAGRSVFQGVGLGKELWVSSSVAGHDVSEQRFQGPARHAEQVRVLLVARERARRLRARGSVRDLPPEWVAAGVARVTVRDPGRFSGSLSPDGSFEVELPERFAPEARLETRQLELHLAGWTPLAITTQVVYDERSGTLDYGERSAPKPEGGARLLVTDRGGKPLWATIRHDEVTHKTDQGGCLRLALRASELPARVRAEAAGHVTSEWLELREPGGEHTFALARSPLVRGGLIVPDGFDLQASELVLELVASGSDEAVALEYREDGDFRGECATVGRHVLRVSLHGVLVLERADLELEAEQETDLGTLDLRGLVFGHSLVLARADGAELQAGEVELLGADGEGLAWFEVSRAGRLWVDSPSASLELWASAAGARPTLFRGVRDGDRLVLPTAPAVLVRVPVELPLPAQPFSLVLRLERTSPADVPFEPDEYAHPLAVVDSRHEVRTSVAWPGSYVLNWSVRNALTEDEEPLELPGQELVVPEDGQATIEARLTRAALAAALARLEE